MRLPVLLAALAASAQAFKNTSPFSLFSSSPLPSHLQTVREQPQLQSASQVLRHAKDILGQCASERYLVVVDPPVSGAELENKALYLNRLIGMRAVNTQYWVDEVVGWEDTETDELVAFLKERCGGSEVVVVEGKDLGGVDNFDSSTVVYAMTPPKGRGQEEMMSYEASFEDPVHMELRRQIVARVPWKTLNNDTRPLFEKYQFFSPGIFMGLVVSLLMLALLGVGLNAISGLEVSYAAFDKEMGPAVHKKPQ